MYGCMDWIVRSVDWFGGWIGWMAGLNFLQLYDLVLLLIALGGRHRMALDGVTIFLFIFFFLSFWCAIFLCSFDSGFLIRHFFFFCLLVYFTSFPHNFMMFYILGIFLCYIYFLYLESLRRWRLRREGVGW